MELSHQFRSTERRGNMIDKCLKCGSRNIMMVEYPHDNPEHYDGVSEIDCEDCKARFGRWTKKELRDGEFEKRYGEKEKQQ